MCNKEQPHPKVKVKVKIPNTLSFCLAWPVPKRKKIGRGIRTPYLLLGGLDGVVGVWWACLLSRVTFEPCQVLLWAWYGVKGEAMAVNEAEHTTGIVWKVRREERL